jgi:hypothetical protein
MGEKIVSVWWEEYRMRILGIRKSVTVSAGLLLGYG